jgi:hypothetical protein
MALESKKYFPAMEYLKLATLRAASPPFVALWPVFRNPWRGLFDVNFFVLIVSPCGVGVHYLNFRI